MKFIIFYLILFFYATLTTFAGTIDPAVPDHKYIEYGSHFKYVVKLCGMYEDKTLFCASAVVIRDDIILTAAHVVKGYKTSVVKTDSLDEIEVNNFIWPKDYDSDKFGTNDIAIGFLKQKLKLDFYPELYDKDDELNKLCCIAGYGITGNFIDGAKIADNKKRAGSNIIESIDRQLLICKPSKLSDKRRTSLEFIIASGDSGGGLFINNKLAGINSCIVGVGKASLKSTYATESCHTRVSIHRDWILKNIDK
jgi:hypothetical protein